MGLAVVWLILGGRVGVVAVLVSGCWCAGTRLIVEALVERSAKVVVLASAVVEFAM